MSAQIVVENVSKRYYLGQPATLPQTELATRVFDAGRRLLRWRPSPMVSAPRESLWALKNVSFKVEQGQRLGIVGANGSGKSTLLKILSRITSPTEGCARLRGRVGSLLEVGTGFHPELTGRENILLNSAVMGMRRDEIRRKFDEIVDFAEIEQFLDVPVKRYSSGMYVRLAFSVAAHLESEILIADEVLAVGDAAFQRKCIGKMENAGNDGRTVLFVSHAMSTVTRLCTHGLLLDKGEIKAYGLAGDVVRDYQELQVTPRTVCELPPNPENAMALRKVQLDPPAGEVSFEDDITLRIEYDVNKEIEDAVVWIFLQTTDSQNVLCTTDHDVDLSMLGARKPGRYCTDARIPGKLLNAGEYMVVVGLNKVKPRGQEDIYNRQETITFKVLNIGTPSLLTQDHYNRRGCIQPFLRWDTARA
jgi:lipopolysaccharide transport system ATP-binding protein